MAQPSRTDGDLADRAIMMMEEERRRIGRDLHDGPVQTLTQVAMRLEIARRLLTAEPEAVDGELQHLSTRVVQAVNEIRQLIFDLQPIAIDEVGLLGAVENLVQGVEREAGIAIRIDDREMPPDMALSQAQQILIFRLLQEALTNVVKHAGAKHIVVRWRSQPDALGVEVEDDGKGFPEGDVPSHHFGLQGRRERLQRVGGDLSVRSRPGAGSVVSIRWPRQATA